MEVEVIKDLFSNYGLPVALCIVFLIALFKIIKSYKDTMDDQKTDIQRLNDRYHEDILKFSDVLKDNTNALNSMNKMVDIFVRKYKNDDDE